jgi:phosphopantetheinyl transferase (holo-ACP synthase)
MPQRHTRLVIIWTIKEKVVKALRVADLPNARVKFNQDINPTHDPQISVSFSENFPHPL